MRSTRWRAPLRTAVWWRCRDFDGYGMGTGFYNSRSKIRVRMMSRKAGQVIDRDFLRMRVQNAWDYRKKTVDTSSCRIIFGEADFLPGLVVDKFSVCWWCSRWLWALTA